jgi:hypothetical protein
LTLGESLVVFPLSSGQTLRRKQTAGRVAQNDEVGRKRRGGCELGRRGLRRTILRGGSPLFDNPVDRGKIAIASDDDAGRARRCVERRRGGTPEGPQAPGRRTARRTLEGSRRAGSSHRDVGVAGPATPSDVGAAARTGGASARTVNDFASAGEGAARVDRRAFLRPLRGWGAEIGKASFAGGRTIRAPL